MRNTVQILDDLDDICDLIEVVSGVCESGQIGDEMADKLPQVIARINTLLYNASCIEIQKFTVDKVGMAGTGQYMMELRKLVQIWTSSVTHQLKSGSMDAMFWNLYDYFCLVDVDTIFENAVYTFKQRSVKVRGLLGEVGDLPWLQGRIDEEKRDFSLIRVYADMIKEHVEDFRWLYEKLADNRSKMILVKLVTYWFNYEVEELVKLRENVFRNYFDLDILSCDENDVFVDCGAFVGDSILDLIDVYGGRYKKIYAYEIIQKTFELLKHNTAGLNHIIYRNVGVSDKKGVMYIDDGVSEGSGSRIAKVGSKALEVVSLDEDICEPVSIIKMDIEGAEMDALNGCRNHILQEKPRLLISAYHRPGDIFDIPRRICEMRDDYQLYLRFNGTVAWPADFVVFGV